MASEIEGKVKEIVCEQLGVAEEEVSLGASFIEEISDEEAEKIRTVGDVVTYIEGNT